MQVIKKIAIRAILYPLILLLLLAGGLVIALQLPWVQTKAVQYATRQLSKQLNFPVRVKGVRIKWFDTITLDSVRIDDRAAQPMIEVNKLDVDFELASLLDTANIQVDEATLHDAKVRLVVDKNTGSLNIDDFISAINELTASRDTTKTTRKPGPDQAFSIKSVTLQNTTFSYSDDREPSLRQAGKPSVFDYYHFTLDSLDIEADRFKVVADTIEVGVNKLQCVNRVTGLRIHQLATFFRYTKRAMSFDDLFARVNQSTLRNHFVFNYPNGTRDFGDFNNNIKMEAHLDSTILYSHDLALFAPELYQFKEKWRISGNFKGKVNSFKIKNMDFYFGHSSHLKGNIGFDGLPNVKETFTNLDLQKSVLHPQDVKQYVDAESYQTIEKFGKVDLRGKFVGFSRDFVANGTFETALGRLVSDINLKVSKEKGKSTYEGKLTTTNFELGKLVDIPETIQKIDMSGRIKGRGLTLEDAVLTLDAKASRLGLYGYDYRNIVVDGDLQKGLFDGQVSIRDENLVFDLAGEVDLKNEPQYVNVAGRLKKANLKALKLSKEELSLETDLNVAFEGLKADDIVGEAHFKNATIMYNNRSLILDSLSLLSSKSDSGRIFSLQSDLLSVDAQGKFEFSQASADIQKLLTEYKLHFTNGQQEQIAYYNQKRKNNAGNHRKYHIDYQFQFKNINPVVALFDPALYVSRNTRLEGRFTNGATSIFSFNSQVDTLLYKNYQFYSSTIDVSTSKLADSANVLASVFISSDKQKLGGFAPTEKIGIEGVWNQDHISFTGNIRQSASTNRANVKGDLRFIPDGLLVKFQPSHFVILDNDWHIAKDNSIKVMGQEITFNNLSVGNHGQVIALNGGFSANPTVAAELQVQDFNLATLAPLISRDVKGMLNGFINLRNVYDTINIDSQLSLEELVIDKFLIGNVAGGTEWDESERRIKANYNVERMGKEIMNLHGTYDPNTPDNSLDLVADLTQADLEILEPFVTDFISNISGNASGKVKIGGKLSSPLLKGELTLKKGRLKYNYLNTFFRFEDKIFFTENEIGTKHMRLLDDEGNGAILQGGVYHDGFQSFVLDLNARLDNFKILNTDEKSGEMYYGTAFATGRANLFGPINNLTIKASVKSNRGTKIFIPLDRSETVEQKDYIHFVSRAQKKDTTQKKAIKKINLSGVKLDFNFELTPEAYCEIIFDKQTGDIIKANGSGKIAMQIDTHGEFTMMGNYEIAFGTYNFTFLNVINKQFTIKPNSRIMWTGDPYSAILDIKAAYVQLASLFPILDQNSKDLNRPEYHRRYPSSVLLNLSGNLRTPQIDLGIELNDYPKTSPFTQNVIAFQARIQSDSQEMSRQAFSLMVLRQLTPIGSFEGANSAIGSNVSELLSNQFSYWISQVDQNLQVDFNINGLDQAAINNLQLKLSYAFLNGRIRVTRNGGFNNNTGNTNNTSSVLGEWTIEYWITPDGKFRMKAYNRNNQNSLTANNSNTSAISTGFSLLHTQSFNSFGELIHPKKKRKALDMSEPEEDEPESTPPVDTQKPQPMTLPPATSKAGNPPSRTSDDRKK
ncbi:MAG: translocation/assembly module TamB domain-containing protein [Bacteroidota bacterium]